MSTGGALAPRRGVDGARVALAAGDALIAYDLAAEAYEDDRDDIAAGYLAALALARAGARAHAAQLLATLSEQLGASPRATPELREDVEALDARLAKDRALGLDGEERRAAFGDAAVRYERVADRHGRAFSCVNAATMWLLAGDDARACELAARALELSRAAAGASYWDRATEAEADLVIGDLDAARVALAAAAKLAGSDHAAVAVTRRQLRLVCRARGYDEQILDGLFVPSVTHYCGHRAADAHLAPDSDDALVEQIAAHLECRAVGFGYGSLASGADILVAEALLARGAELHVVLPFASEEFDRVSVAPAGPDWSRRFHDCLARATSVVQTCDSAYLGDDALFAHAARVAMGRAINRSRFLDADAEQVAIWDGRATASVGGTSYDVSVWRNTGRESHVIAVPERPRRGTGGAASQSAVRPLEREVRAILFADFHGFSRLRDEQFPVFVAKVLSALAAVLEAHAGVLWSNTWGDAVAAVTTDVATAAACVLDFQDAIGGLDGAALDLPTDLDLRIGAHAGPVMAIFDPVTRRPTYWGRELTRAARIEPRTPAGEVFVTDAFAALLALEGDPRFVTEYAGRVTTAKGFETIPVYKLWRAHR